METEGLFNRQSDATRERGTSLVGDDQPPSFDLPVAFEPAIKSLGALQPDEAEPKKTTPDPKSLEKWPRQDNTKLQVFGVPMRHTVPWQRGECVVC
jgi:hypothetical protein